MLSRPCHLPLVLLLLVVLHLGALHEVGSNNPDGVEIKAKKDALGRPLDGIPFHPYYTVKDGFAIILFLMMFAVFVFYNPNALGHADNYIQANPLVTPAHIVPEWYMLPFYAILRAIPDKFGGVVAMFAAIGVLFVLPWLDTSKVKSTAYRPVYKVFFWIFAVNAVFLGWLGSRPAEGIYPLLSLIGTIYYFGHFLIVLPVLGLVETPKKLPASITEAVLAKHAARHGGAEAVAKG